MYSWTINSRDYCIFKKLGTWYIEVHRNLCIYGSLIYKILRNLQIWGIAILIIQKRFQCPCVGNSKVNFGTKVWYQNRNTLLLVLLVFRIKHEIQIHIVGPSTPETIVFLKHWKYGI